MNQAVKPAQPEHSHHLADEADIGSGEKNPAQKETEDLIKQIPPLSDNKPAKPN